MNAITVKENEALAQSDKEYPFRMLSDIVVIEQSVEEKSKGGIVLLGDDRKLPCGRVVAVGPGRVYTSFMDASGHNQAAYFVPTTVKVGDWVTFGRYQTGEPHEIDGKRYLVAREGDLAGVSKNGDPIVLHLAKVE